MELKRLDFPVALVEIPHPTDADQKFIKDRKAIVRTDTHEVLNIVSRKYPLVKHAEMFGAIDEAIGKMGLPVIDVKESSANSGGYGKVVWTLDKQFKVSDHGFDDDRLNFNITARNSYNYSSVVVLELGTLRQICTNGATVGELFAGARKRHVPSLKVEDLIKQIMGLLAKTDAVQERMNRWSAIEYDRTRLDSWLTAKPDFPKRARIEILDYFTAQPDRAKVGAPPAYTGWEALNSITWFGTHAVRSRSEDTLMVAQERINGLAMAFTREELEHSAHRRRN